MTSNDEAAHAASEVHAASETNLNIPLVSSQGADNALSVEAATQDTPPHGATAGPTGEVTPQGATAIVETDAPILCRDCSISGLTSGGPK